ncbi:MAG: Gfo/Idh/MocA family oxidoreductase [Candidatus Eisenbacteria bacterium]
MSAVKRVRLGVVGVGHLGRQHARVAASLPEAELVGVFDSDSQTAARVAGELNARVFDSLEGLLSAVDAVTVAVPTTSHFDVASRCLAAGTHVLVEKPLAATLEEARELVRQSEGADAVLQTGHVERFNPVVQETLGLITHPRFIEGHRLSVFLGRSTDVDVVLDLMIHDIDLSLATVHSEVRSVEAVGVPILTGNVDIANARILFENGAVANLTASRVSREKVRKIRFFGSQFYVSVDCLAGRAELYRKLERGDSADSLGKDWEETQIAPGIVRRVIVAPQKEPLRLELESFVRCVLRGEKPIVDGTAGIRAMEVAFRINETIRDAVRVHATREDEAGGQGS